MRLKQENTYAPTVLQLIYGNKTRFCTCIDKWSPMLYNVGRSVSAIWKNEEWQLQRARPISETHENKWATEMCLSGDEGTTKLIEDH